MDINATNAEPAYLTTAEVAQRFRVSPETVRYWRWHSEHDGTPVGPQGWVRVGRRCLLPVASLHDYEAGLTKV